MGAPNIIKKTSTVDENEEQNRHNIGKFQSRCRCETGRGGVLFLLLVTSIDQEPTSFSPSWVKYRIVYTIAVAKRSFLL